MSGYNAPSHEKMYSTAVEDIELCMNHVNGLLKTLAESYAEIKACEAADYEEEALQAAVANSGYLKMAIRDNVLKLVSAIGDAVRSKKK